MNYNEISYSQLIDWLFIQFPSFQKTGNLTVKMGLSKIDSLAGAMCHPECTYPTIHVAGTNGKGSVSSMTAAVLASTGLKVGLYTSPHLSDFRERMKVVTEEGWEMIPEDEVRGFLTQWMQFFLDNDLSFFEITTAMAFEWFARQKVDVAVIEVGLGGRLDATNIIVPKLSIITNISLEHCQYLGNTLEAIAGEKAGIIKPGIPVVIGEALPQTRPVFERIAKDRNAPITFAEDSIPAKSITVRLEQMDLQGDYQKRNLRTATAAINGLREAGFRITPQQELHGICHAATMTGLRGRWETLRKAESGKARIICDTGHNAHAFRWLREQIDSISCNYDTVWFILGVVADKNLDAIANYLPHDVNYIFTAPSTGRALPSATLASHLSDFGISGKVTGNISEALAAAESVTGENDLIFIAGSNYLIADLLEII